ncbi:hypothetical protein OH77DRAFT_1431752 [Trametes cingulata]|nr:hypothetical protein OH77DRAFT_1431752 [Trametes cingulata]
MPDSPFAIAQPHLQYSAASVCGPAFANESFPCNTDTPFPHLPHDILAAPPLLLQDFHMGARASTQGDAQQSSSPIPASPESLYTTPSSSSRGSSAAPHRRSGKKATSVLRRNAVISPSASPYPRSPISPTDNYTCPYCGHVPRNKLASQLRRHIKTHTRPADAEDQPWVCCGVPLVDAQAYAVPQALRVPVEYEGILVVGGCGKTFSRRDALRRHLRRRAGKCFGNPQGSWLRGNQYDSAR